MRYPSTPGYGKQHTMWLHTQFKIMFQHSMKHVYSFSSSKHSIFHTSTPLLRPTARLTSTRPENQRHMNPHCHIHWPRQHISRLCRFSRPHIHSFPISTHIIIVVQHRVCVHMLPFSAPHQHLGPPSCSWRHRVCNSHPRDHHDPRDHHAKQSQQRCHLFHIFFLVVVVVVVVVVSSSSSERERERSRCTDQRFMYPRCNNKKKALLQSTVATKRGTPIKLYFPVKDQSYKAAAACFILFLSYHEQRKTLEQEQPKKDGKKEEQPKKDGKKEGTTKEKRKKEETTKERRNNQRLG